MSDLFITDSILETGSTAVLTVLAKPTKKTKSENVELDFLDINHKAKEIMNQVEFVATHRRTEYVAELLNLQFHKSVAVRRKVATSLGLIAGQNIVNDLQTWLLHEPDKETYLVVDSTIERLSRKLESENNQSSGVVLTVSEAIKAIKLRVSEKTFVVEGELGDVRAFGQMYYFVVKDSDETAINCQCYSGKVAGFGFPLNEGWSIRMEGKFKVDKQSKLKFEVEKMSLTGDGEILRKLQELEIKLNNEGLFDPTRKRKIDQIPTRILLIASPNSAAIQDFLKVFGARRGGVTIYFLPIKTQGVGAEYEILSKLELSNYMCDKHDIQTVVLTRGGGSKEDLMVFNSEKVVRAIYGLNRPSIVAIGHERDECLAEKVADLRASTPSNAAELCSISQSELLFEIQNISGELAGYFQVKKTRYEDFTRSNINNIINSNQSKILGIKKTCHQIDILIHGQFGAIRGEINSNYNRSKQVLTQKINYIKYSLQSSLRLQNLALPRVKNYQNQTKFYWESATSKILQKIFWHQNQVIATWDKINLHDSAKILSLGYAIATQNGKVVDKIAKYDSKQRTTLKLQDGVVEI
jgi:exodeoxyribonuclease VII large subunit